MRKFVFGAAAVVGSRVCAVPVWAAGDGEKVGENVGHLLGAGRRTSMSGSPRWWR